MVALSKHDGACRGAARVLEHGDRIQLAVAVEVARDHAEQAWHRPPLLTAEGEVASASIATPQPRLQLAMRHPRLVAFLGVVCPAFALWREGARATSAAGHLGGAARAAHVAGCGDEEEVDKVVGVVVAEGDEGAAGRGEADVLRHLLQTR